MRATRVLVVDDDPGIVILLRDVMSGEVCEILEASDGVKALSILEAENLDMIILDLVMPGMNGLEVLRRVRDFSGVPIIVLSGRSEMIDKVECLELGADDYITKPFAGEELTARFRAVLRRHNSKQNDNHGLPLFADGRLIIDLDARRVTLFGNEVELTPTEYRLLQELAGNPGKTLTYQLLLNRIWGTEYEQETEYLYVHIAHLRTKIEPDPTHPEYIYTVPRVGYHFKDSPYGDPRPALSTSVQSQLKS